jgi:phosphoglycerol transferase MdoB-like AlkP superfamily enzyme
MASLGGLVSPRLKSGPVRPLFRLLALVVGPLLLCAGLLLVILDLRGVNAQGWPVWSRRLHAALWLGLGNLVLGWRILHAARTGVDPYDVAAGEHPPDEDPDR